MRKIVLGVVFAGLVTCAPAVAMAQGGGPYGEPYYDDPYARVPQHHFSGDVSLLVGGKTLDSSWIASEVRHQFELAVMFDVKGPYWPVSFAFDLRASVGEPYLSATYFTDVYASTTELNLGVRKIMDMGGPFRPYYGGGISLVTMEFASDISGTTIDDGSGTGYWLGIGAYFDMSQHFHLGLDLTWSDVDANLAAWGTVPVGGQHFGLMFGYHW